MKTSLWDTIIPSVKMRDFKPGSFPIPREIRVWVGNERAREAVDASLVSIGRISAGRPGDPSWTFVAGRDAAHVSARLDGEAVDHSAGTDPWEAFFLAVRPAGITITAAEPQGIAAGMSALYQAVLRAVDGDGTDGANNNALLLPAVDIVDAPAHGWRGFMLDTARHFFPPDALHRTLDMLWFLRLNRFHLHLTDDQGWRVPVDGYPRLTEVGGWRHDGTTEDGLYGGSYSREDLSALDSAAEARGIEVIPEIDLPGHASAAITAYPEIGCTGRAPGVQTRWGIFDAVICPVGDESARFIDAVFGSVSELFHGEHIHIGGDEVITRAWQESSLCTQNLRDRGLESVEELYGIVVRAMAEAVLSRGKRPIAWDEAAQLDLPPETIIANWREPEYAAAALDRGHDIVLVPQARRAYLDHKHRDGPLESGRLGTCTVRDSASFEPNRYVAEAVRGRSSGGAGCILGGQTNLWTEAIATQPQVEYMSLVRLAAVSEGLWAGAPGVDRWDNGFRHNLDAYRQSLFRRGYNVYPGALE